MHIGLDAKRAFQNSTGLGNYSRTLIASVAGYFPANDYYLFAPKITVGFDVSPYNNIKLITPQKFPFKMLRSAWRSFAMVKNIEEHKIDIFHGLSHELPAGIQKTGARSVVTMHDLIFERFPDQYKKTDRWIYRKKFKHACKYADAIIAISQQTKNDLIELYKIPEQKITVCYQSCDPIFSRQVTSEEKEKVRSLYRLPERFFLSVGSIIERKNLLTICKAMNTLKSSLAVPLVVIGNGGKYKVEVKKYIEANGLEDLIIFLSENEEAKSNEGFRSSAHFPAIYQCAEALIYPSVAEGFGIPVLEAMCSRLPVMTSDTSCLPEAGGDAAAYISPFDDKALAATMNAIANDKVLAASMAEKGWAHAQNFTTEKTATAVMEVYKKLIP
jgi:glycosyltransferase involved in cell wall biosynthesis